MGYFETSPISSLGTVVPKLMRSKPKLMALVRAMVWGLQLVYLRFASNRDANLYDLRHNGQTCKIEAVLQDVWGPLVYIGEYSYADAQWLYLKAERQPLWLHMKSENKPVYLFLRSEMTLGTGVFVVNVPVDGVGLDIVYDELRLKALLNKYKLASTQYIINYYS